MAGERRLDYDLLDSLYSAVSENDSWEHFLASLGARIAAPGVAFLFHSHSGERYELGLHFGLPPETLSPYAQYYGKIDPFCAYGKVDLSRDRGKAHPAPTVVLGSKTCPPSRFRETEFYVDFLKKYRPFLYQVALILDDCAGEHGVLTCMRELGQPDFSHDTLRFLEGLVPHLRWALQIHHKMAAYKTTSAFCASVLNRVDIGVIGIQGNGALAFANAKAELLLQSGDFLRVRNGKVICMDSGQGSAFRRLWQSTNSRTIAILPGGALTLRHGDSSLHVTALPWSDDRHLFPRPCALLVLTDPEAEPRHRHTLLQELFGLTRLQADITVRLMRGLQSKQIADQIHCTAEDVRYHLTQIYRKANVQGQTQLVRLISLLPGQE